MFKNKFETSDDLKGKALDVFGSANLVLPPQCYCILFVPVISSLVILICLVNRKPDWSCSIADI